MAKTTTVTIKYQGVPLGNATVIWGDVLNAGAVTDVNGQLSAPLDDNYVSIEWIAIKHSSFPSGTVALGIALIEAGKNYEYNIPTIENTPATQSNILKEIT